VIPPRLDLYGALPREPENHPGETGINLRGFVWIGVQPGQQNEKGNRGHGNGEHALKFEALGSQFNCLDAVFHVSALPCLR
jgi:hypothetical protein